MSLTYSRGSSRTQTGGGRTRGAGPNRGRGRGRGSTTQTSGSEPQASMYGNRGAPAPARGQHHQQPQQRDVSPSKRELGDRMERRDAFTVIAPDEKKRNQVAAMAKKEEDNYNQYKEQNRVGYVSYVGTVGGGALDGQSVNGRGGARPKAGPAASGRPPGHILARTTPKKTQAEWRAEKKKQDDKMYEQKKTEARQKSAENARREQTRQQQLDEDRRRCNEAFLAKLEGKKPGKTS